MFAKLLIKYEGSLGLSFATNDALTRNGVTGLSDVDKAENKIAKVCSFAYLGASPRQ